MIAAVRLLQRLRPGSSGDDGLDLPGPLVNGVLEAVFACERHVLPRLRLPFGVSLLAVARKA